MVTLNYLPAAVEASDRAPAKSGDFDKPGGLKAGQNMVPWRT